MKNLLVLSSVFLLCSLSQYSLAQQTGDKTDSSSATEQKADTQKKPTATKAPAAPRSSKTDSDFKPSEEVSEDLSVSFPVDI